MPAVIKYFRREFFRWLLAGQIVFLTLALNDPGFADSLKDTIIWFLLLPAFITVMTTLFHLLKPAKNIVLEWRRFFFIQVSFFVTAGALTLLRSIGLLPQIIVMFVLPSAIFFLLRIVIKNADRFPRFQFPALLILLLFNSLIIFNYHRTLDRTVAKSPLLIYCVDGADWRIIDPLLKDGALPNFQKVIDSGSRAYLQSEEPLFSPIVWTTIITGRYPAEHRLLGHFSHLDATLIRSRRLWDIAEEHGLKSGAVQFLGLWPLGPHPSAFAVPSIFERGSQSLPPGYDFIAETWASVRTRRIDPGDICYFAFQSFICGMRLSTLTSISPLSETDMSDFLLVKIAVSAFTERLYQDIFLHLLWKNPVDLAVYYYPKTDGAGHLYFKQYTYSQLSAFPDEESCRLGNVLINTYKDADCALGRFRKILPANTDILICSDHGMTSSEDIPPSGYSRFYNLKTDFAEMLGLQGKVEFMQGADKVFVTPVDENTTPLNDIIALANSVKVKSTGAPLFRNGFRGGDGKLYPLCSGENTFGIVEITFAIPDSLPDSTVVQFPGGDYRLGDFSVTADKFQFGGCHYLWGIFMACGEGIRRGAVVDTLSILDILPTALAMLKMPQSADFAGRPADIFTPDYLDSLPAKIQTYDAVPYIPIDYDSAKNDSARQKAAMENWRAVGYIK